MAITNPDYQDFKNSQVRALDYQQYRSTYDVLRAGSFFAKAMHYPGLGPGPSNVITDGFVVTAEHHDDGTGEEKLYITITSGAAIKDDQPIFITEDFIFEYDIPDNVTTYYVYIRYKYVEEYPPNIATIVVTTSEQPNTDYLKLAEVVVDPDNIVVGDNESGVSTDTSARDDSYDSVNNANTASDIQGGNANQILYQVASDDTGFIPAPTEDGFLKYDSVNDSFEWSGLGDGGGIDADYLDGLDSSKFLRTDTTTMPENDASIDLGASDHRFDTIYAVTFEGTASSAEYADLAEKYVGPRDLQVGTVVAIALESQKLDTEICLMDPNIHSKVAGVVSDKPSYLMNSSLADGVVIGLIGRVPVRVVGKVEKGDILYAHHSIPGVAVSEKLLTLQDTWVEVGTALETNMDGNEKLVETKIRL